MAVFGDILKTRLEEGKFLESIDTSAKKDNAFWIVLRDTAYEDIKNVYPQKVDSDIAVELYYSILLNNLDYLPEFCKETLNSNGQERFRVANRNTFTSNAFHTYGLANQENMIVEKVPNLKRKGEKIIFQYKGEIAE